MEKNNQHPAHFLTNFQIYKDVKNRNARQMSMSRTAATTTQQARRKQVGASEVVRCFILGLGKGELQL